MFGLGLELGIYFEIFVLFFLFHVVEVKDIHSDFRTKKGYLL